ncbi:hypothetical protein EHT25_08750 [Larkinella rosea]|uniref:Transposase n=1 Tax=Larkinella rosea TaxID=2025312 RepID=A0A3P1C3H3_9BACT|nr:hypothetical protein EHT25_08750 [Larkinella rosea]
MDKALVLGLAQNWFIELKRYMGLNILSTPMDLLTLTGGCFLADLRIYLNLTIVKRRVIDPAFKEMAVELSFAKGSVKEAAKELGIDPSRITKWRQQKVQPEILGKVPTRLTEEQKQIRQLQKELKETLLERDILKKVVNIFSKGDGKPFGL